MSIVASDIKFRKSATITDTSVNGGRKGSVEVISGSRHSFFPRVTKAERTAGVTRYRKEFFSNENADDDSAYDVMAYLEMPSNGGDRFYIAKGAFRDTQGDIITTPLRWMGTGQLATGLTGGEVQVVLNMENDDFEFPNGSYLHIHNKVMTSQTITAGVRVGDSVEWSVPLATWQKIASQTDITYPYGIMVDTGTVLSDQTSDAEEWAAIAENQYTDEDIGDGDGGTNNPALSTLINNTNGISLDEGYLPVVTATCGATARTVNVAADGTCSGYCSAGVLDMDTGIWTTDIVWTTNPDAATDITCTYSEKAYSYTGNQVTVDLDDAIANVYLTANTYAGPCIYDAEVTPTFESWTETAAVSGGFDEATYPPVLYNKGTVEDTITLTFTSATAFDVSGLYAGSLGSGVITSDFEPVNSETGVKYFTIDKDGWSGTWQSGDTVSFITRPAAIPIWWKEVVPAATTAEPDNLAILGWYSE